MAWFSGSTHCQHWLLSPAGLAQLRAHTAARLAAAAPAADADGGASKKREGEAGRLTGEEELLLLRHWEFKLQEIGKKLELPAKVQATGTVLLKRFYLHHSATEHDPKHMMLTALYVATKVEEWNIDLVSFVSPFQLPPDTILRAELVLLHALRFQLVVWHALRPIVALTQELRDRALADADTVRAEATAAYMALLTTDVPLLHAPAVVALACVRAARPAAVDALIEERLRAQHPDVNLRAVTSDIIAQLEHARAPPDQERVRKADLKLRRSNKRAKPAAAPAGDAKADA